MSTPPVLTPGAALKKLLKEKDIKNSEAADLLDVSRALLSMMLSDRARITTKLAVRIERRIGGSAADLVYPQAAADLAEERAKETA
jgi:addiction module HigA family antidote